MEVPRAFILLVLLSCFATASYAHNVHLSSLNQSLVVTTSPTSGQVLKAGVDTITITWEYNVTYPTTDTNYSTVDIKLCYAPVSQTGRDDRKTDDSLDFDKTCPFLIADEPYKRSNNTFVWTVLKDTPTATYFVRVYAVKANNHEIAYGQSTNALKTTNLFQVDGVISNQTLSPSASPSATPSATTSAAWPMFGNSFGYHYAWLLTLFLV